VNLILRMLRVLLGALRARRLTVGDESKLAFRCWPHDLDVNLHMNNGRYLALMDLGRVDLIVRAGLLRPLLRHRWQPLVGGIVVQYRRGLRPFERFELRTRTLGWDDKWFFIEQRFERRGQLVAQAMVRALFRGRDGNVPPARVLVEAGQDGTSPPMPAALSTWDGAEKDLFTPAT
jgi:acyl-CoA thioesterase FadM